MLGGCHKNVIKNVATVIQLSDYRHHLDGLGSRSHYGDYFVSAHLRTVPFLLVTNSSIAKCKRGLTLHKPRKLSRVYLAPSQQQICQRRRPFWLRAAPVVEVRSGLRL